MALQLLPRDVDLRYDLACAAWANGDLRRTRTELEEVLRRSPDYARAHDTLARLHHGAGEPDAAEGHSHRAVELNPSEPDFALTRGIVLASMGRDAEAWDAVGPAMQSDETADRAAALRATLAPKLDRVTEALAMAEAALARPAGAPEFRRRLHFATGTLYDRIGRYDDAFTHVARARSMIKRPYDPVARSRDFDLRITHRTAARVAALPRATHGSQRPVFIVGMPRSGTSLVEQILACHPMIHGGGELTAMNQTAKALDATGLQYPRSVESLTTENANRVAQIYLDSIDRLDKTKPFVTDKLPFNFIYLDLIRVLLPDCHVIHCTRDPMDTCVSCYMTEFETGNEFADDLHNLGRFYTDYRRLMKHWREVLPLKMLEVRYEDVVADLEGQTRRMLDFLGVEFDEHCLRFHESDREVKTASRDQVRRPLYASSVGRWRHYARYLGPLREALGLPPRP